MVEKLQRFENLVHRISEHTLESFVPEEYEIRNFCK